MLSALAVTLSAAKRLLSSYKEWRWALIAGVVVLAIAGLTCHRHAAAPIPPPVTQLIERHEVQGAVDSIEITKLKRSAAASNLKRDTAVVHATQAADSGNYKTAYAFDDTALVAMQREVVLDVALTRSESRAVRADSVIAAVLPLAQAAEPPCRILWVFSCPSRRAVAGLAAAATAAVIILHPRVQP